MPGTVVVATANVLCTLERRVAQQVLAGVLDVEPDLIGLQEWGVSRLGLLRTRGYHWSPSVYGGCPVGAREDRYQPLESGMRLLGGFGRCDAGIRAVPVLPPRVATVARFLDRQTARTVAVINYHLVPGVQSRGDYREDRPLLAARHRLEVRRLSRLVSAELARGHVVHALGDSNFDGLRLPGLTSAWEGRESDPRGTLGSARKIDDVFGPGPATSVTLLENASDHRALVVRQPAG